MTRKTKRKRERQERDERKSKKIKDFIFTVSVLYSDIRVQNTVKYDATAGTQTHHMIQVYLGMQRYL